jgi:hypothetical protein
MNTVNKIKQYKRYFQPDEVPSVLVKLLEFDDGQDGFFSGGFELELDSDDVGFKTYSDKPDFLDCLYTIGQATASGSSYAIWRQTGPLSEAPIVVFGDEGGVHIVAENVLGLFRILTFDAEPMVDWQKVTYYKGDDAEPSEYAADYVDWLAENFNLKPVKDAEEVAQIVKDAQKVHGEKFQAWLRQYCR